MGCFSIASKKTAKVKSRKHDVPEMVEESGLDTDAVEDPQKILEISQLSYDDISKATRSFSVENLIGEGSFGRAYRGISKSGHSSLAFKIANGFGQTQSEFFEEISGLSQIVHPNVTALKGFCSEGSNRILVYDFATYGSLQDVLHGKSGIVLDWSQRVKIAYGAALGLKFLHDLPLSPPFVHRQIKSSNILLFENFHPRITDIKVGSKASEKLAQLISSGILGTFGYQAPEYVMTAQWTQKSDVYSFGIILLELLTGRKPSCGNLPARGQRQKSLVNWALPKLTADNVEQCVDPNLDGNYPLKSIAQFAALAALSLQSEAVNRPNMNLISKSLKKLVEASERQTED